MVFMDSASIRRENLRTLRRELGTNVVLDRLDMTKQLLSHYIGKNPKKQIGDDLARRVEVAFEKDYGWMDHLHGQYGDIVQNIVDFAMSLPPEQLTPLLTFLKGASMFSTASQEPKKKDEE
jgi:hypothetical protein